MGQSTTERARNEPKESEPKMEARASLEIRVQRVGGSPKAELITKRTSTKPIQSLPERPNIKEKFVSGNKADPMKNAETRSLDHLSQGSLRAYPHKGFDAIHPYAERANQGKLKD